MIDPGAREVGQSDLVVARLGECRIDSPMRGA
jgi:hypothetical protein